MDAVGNLLTRTRTSTTTTYAAACPEERRDRADRISSATTPSSGTSYTVNAVGNMTARGSDTLAYDQANRLTSTTVGSTTASYTYDGDGKRASKTVGSTTTSYVYDTSRGLPVLLEDGTRRYVWGLGLAYEVEGTSALVYHADGLGSVRALTDSTKAVVQTYESDEFGVPITASGGSSQPFGYTGEQRDSENGLLHLRARMYDPGIGRFFQRDALPGQTTSPASQHRFAYAHGNPANNVDPSGHFTVGLCASGDLGLGVYVTGAICPLAVSIDQMTGRYQYAFIFSGGPGATNTLLGGISVGGQVTNARFLDDLNGWSQAVGAGVRAGGSVGLEVVSGQDPRNDPYRGGNIAVGTGLAISFFEGEPSIGFEIHGNTTYSYVFKIYDSTYYQFPLFRSQYKSRVVRQW